MLPSGQPRWRRRKDARPAEIVSAALAVFAEKGFAAARLDEIAARAGVSKGALYLYFETKEDLFRAVVRQAVAPNIEAIEAAVEAWPGDFAGLVRAFLVNVATMASTLPIGGVAKMIIGESRNFPELAKIWHDDLVARALRVFSAAIARAQVRGEVRPGDPRAYAIGFIGPILLGVIWEATFVPVGAEPFDVPALAHQHVEALLEGMLVKETRP
ncbi:MAG TPA: TetR/AcrR family transcriptional regulator [Caulobacteraceae bacterium]|nr:TetR/AcrR family transcriptional regulator [Caulobacteraceae bacterium]